MTDATVLTVLRELIDHGPISRPVLGGAVGLARATVSSSVNDLRRRGLVTEVPGESNGRRGRPTTGLDLDDSNFALAGLEIAVDRVRVAVYSLRGRELLRQEHVVDSEVANPRALLRQAAAVLHETLGRINAEQRELLGVGVSVPGLVDASTGTVKYVPSLGWHDVALQKGVVEALGVDVPVIIDSDANFAVLAERRARLRAGVEGTSIVYLTGTYGISAGIVTGGQVWRGSRGMAGEVGHLILESSGLPCVCGRNGCFETRAGIHALIDAADPSARRSASSPAGLAAAIDHLLARASDGDTSAMAALTDAGTWLGRGSAILAALLDPDVIILGGHYSRLEPWILRPARASLSESLLIAESGMPDLEVSARGVWGATEGAALAVLHRLAAAQQPLP
ncbi:putative NBD/HSP70 family sugar kinase/biotin operon repressor [Kribbella aluminosa]|uniref:NBD/HSP70 family sugar kinase/biotin operon repressor n=1 Tax=Kribbella aluminosa TaxID=416017 RepID=A0ABS4UJK3_9ACTN|nr:ROK family transcriptional regulator [Kribbella aluminosa]MBP2351805.1 putative NBD/HSP70 family sugar kinase/biotin operon repressor [Kribbella aluminosa]